MSVDKNVAGTLQAWAIKHPDGHVIKVSLLGTEWLCWREWLGMWNGDDDAALLRQVMDTNKGRGFSCVRVRISEVGASPRQSSKEGE